MAYKRILPLLFAALPFVAFADNCPETKSGLSNPLGYCDLPTFLSKLLTVVAQIGFPIIVLSIVYVGFKYITAQGNPEALKKIHPLFMWVIIGALIVLGAQALSYGIQATVKDLQQPASQSASAKTSTSANVSAMVPQPGGNRYVN